MHITRDGTQHLVVKISVADKVQRHFIDPAVLEALVVLVQAGHKARAINLLRAANDISMKDAGTFVQFIDDSISPPKREYITNDAAIAYVCSKSAISITE